jgi:SSS family solute:Na+ symporter
VQNLSLLDTTVVVFYLLVVVVVGLYFGRRQDESSSGFFLAGRRLGWLAIGASLFATNISGEHFLGLAGSGASHGFIVGHFEWIAIIVLLIVGSYLAPVYLRAGVFTTSAFLDRRFGPASKLFFSGYSIFIYILTKISITLFAGGVLLRAVLGWDMYTSAVIMVTATGIYSVIGGFRAIISTHILQTFLMLVAMTVLTIVGLNAIGGISALQAALPATHFEIFRPASDPDFPWTGIVFGAPILAFWYWGADQYMVQRLLAASDRKAALNGTRFAALLKLWPVFGLILPGMIAVVLYPNISGDAAFAALLTGDLLPNGLRGLVVASIFAAMMSSLASSFHSAATLFTRDIYMHWRPQTSEAKQVLVARLTAMLFVLTAILWIPLTRLLSNQMYIYMQNVQAFLSPPIVAVFIMAVWWHRGTGKAALITLAGGSTLGLLRLAGIIDPSLSAAFPLSLQWFFAINFLHFAVFLFCLSLFSMLVFSYAGHFFHSRERAHLVTQSEKKEVLN